MDHLISLLITIFGAFLGVWIGISYTNRKELAISESSRKASLKALLESFEQNLQYLTQIIDLATTTSGGIHPETSPPTSSPHPSLANFQGVIQLIASSRKLLESEIETLKKFV